MQSCRSTTVRHRTTSSGFTLVEVMVVMIVVAVLTGFAMPSYRRTLGQSQADVAAANLRAIWAAERAYWLENHQYATGWDVLYAAGLIDPQITSEFFCFCFAFHMAFLPLILLCSFLCFFSCSSSHA